MTDLPSPDWSNVLNSGHRIIDGGITRFSQFARELGYPYVAWNGWVYRTDDFTPGSEDARVCLAEELPRLGPPPEMPDPVAHGDYTLEPYVLTIAPTIRWRVRGSDGRIVITACSTERHAVRMLTNRINEGTPT